MKEQNVARAYAKALIELADKDSIDVCKEITDFNVVINENNDLENLLFLDVFTAEEKQSVVGDVLAKLGTSPMLKNFLFYMIQEKRINLFPLVSKEAIVLDDHRKGFLRGTIEGSESEMSDEVFNKLKAFVASKIGSEPSLEYKTNDSITAGYKVTVEDLMLDATVDNQLNELKNTILDL